MHNNKLWNRPIIILNIIKRWIKWIKQLISFNHQPVDESKLYSFASLYKEPIKLNIFSGFDKKNTGHIFPSNTVLNILTNLLDATLWKLICVHDWITIIN